MPESVLNPSAQVRVVRQGRERQPVIVIDEMLADPDHWRILAAQAEYGRIGAHYPGLRAIFPEPASEAMRAELDPLLAKTFELDPVPPVFECYFSIVTTSPEALAPIQRLPHVDGLERDRIAILIYLSGGEMGGTAFYRQRATGFESLDADRFASFKAALEAGVAEHGLPAPGYISGDTPLYERIATHEALPNRALIYRSRALHCGEIAPGAPLPADPARGRLTINGFLFDPRRGT
jgi:hypothetical protein